MNNETIEGIKVSEQQRKVLHFLSLGLSAEEIAGKLFISRFAVNSSLQKMRKKWNCSNSSGLVSFAIRNKII